MPQMSPSYWTLIFFTTIICLYSIMSIIFFNNIYFKNKKKINKNYLNKWKMMW